jgi:hypothetical protein
LTENAVKLSSLKVIILTKPLKDGITRKATNEKIRVGAKVEGNEAIKK